MSRPPCGKRAGSAVASAAAFSTAWGHSRMPPPRPACMPDRKSTRLNSSHVKTSYAVLCLNKNIDFRGVKVRDVMLPLPRVVAVEPIASIEEALELSASSGVDRLPVITPEDEQDGLVNVLD